MRAQLTAAQPPEPDDGARIAALRPLPHPQALRREQPLSAAARQTVSTARQDIAHILGGEDDRLVVVSGPCSVHDHAAAMVYAERLARLAADHRGALLVVMRVYVEKPRTRLGWRGMAYDPALDGSCDIAAGLRAARRLMLDIAGTGLPVGCEFLDPFVARCLSDAVSWAAIGARTVSSPVHRQLASGLDMPVGMKNGIDGRMEDAIDAIVAASCGQVFCATADDGSPVCVTTTGNPDCHLVLRGGRDGPNCGSRDVARAAALLREERLAQRVIIDASHANSGKDHERQSFVVADLARRVAGGETAVAGVMLESFLAAGRQDLVPGRGDRLAFGQSITDACLDWNRTALLLDQLAEAAAVRAPAVVPFSAASALAG
jgi:3-deoxy-7-phosphoheptulonate synthase